MDGQALRTGRNQEWEGLDQSILQSCRANINRNILLRDIGRYAGCLRPGGLLYLSGFYLKDMELLEQECNGYRLFYRRHLSQESWAAMEFYKK